MIKQYELRAYHMNNEVPGTYGVLAELKIDNEYAPTIVEAIIRSFAELFDGQVRTILNPYHLDFNHPVRKWMLWYEEVDPVAQTIDTFHVSVYVIE